MTEFNLNQHIIIELTAAGKLHILTTKTKSYLESKHVKGDWYKFLGSEVFELFPSSMPIGKYMHMNIKLKNN